MTSSTDQFCVIKSEEILVVPCEPTPNHTLPLSWFDKTRSTVVRMFFVYEYGPKQPAKVIKQALAKALVPYYPLAGRIAKSEQGEIIGVACTGDGVWFVAASADCDLAAVTDRVVENPTPSGFPKDQLFPSHPDQVGMPIMLQVTQFTCGGFLVGLKYDHIIADGSGAAQFMKAVGEIARGLNQPTVKPIWLRKHAPSSPFPKVRPGPNKPLENIIIDVPQDHISQVKDWFMEQTGERCSTFDVTVAQLWQCRIQAINLDPTIDARLSFAADARAPLSYFLPDSNKIGYYGNCVFPMRLATPSCKIVMASIIEVVTLIRDTKKRLSDEFFKWAKGELDPYSVVSGYESISLTDWSSLGFSEVDYGWGGPAYFAPIPMPSELDLFPFCIIIKPPKPREGRRLITRCVKKEHLEAFHSKMINFSTNMNSIMY